MTQECLENPNIHSIFNNKKVCKSLWLVIFLLSFSLFVAHSSSLIRKYVEQEIGVSVIPDGTNFIPPDIYVCNNIPFSLALMDKYYSANNTDYINMLATIKNHSNNNPFYFSNLFYNRQLNEFSSNRNFSDFLQLETPKFLPPFRELFEQVKNIKHTLCYKLKEEYKKTLYDRWTFTMYVDEKNFTEIPLNLNHLKEEYTHTIYLVNKNEYPHPESININIERGQKTTIEVTAEYHSKLNRETKPCMEVEETVTFVSH